MKRLNEREIIDLFISYFDNPVLKKVYGDDVIILPLDYNTTKRSNKRTNLTFVLKSDMLIESTDVPKIMKPWQIARKSILACVSDFAAKGIRPHACLISIGIPRTYSKNNIIALAKGFSLASKEFKVPILGGDTNESKELTIDCNMMGITTLPDTQIPRRKGAMAGDVIVTSGKFGYTSSGLKIILSNFNVNAEKKFKSKSLSSVTFPRPQVEFGFRLAKYFSSSIDSSDGLSSSLYELAQKSNEVDFVINKLPIDKKLCHFANLNSISIENLLFFGGEEYETIATVPASNFKKMLRVAKKHKIKIFEIGEVLKGSGNVIYEKGGIQKVVRNKGFVHFSK
jgi:thiamine-monophosphate kinase